MPRTLSPSRYAALGRVDWDFPASAKGDSIHSIHPYPAKFIPEIPRTLIELLGVPEGTVVLDPFCGSGVTLVEAQRMGFPSVGVDLNPIACLLSRVKTQPGVPDLDVLAGELVARAKRGSPGTPPLAIPNVDHWFEKPVQEAIQGLVRAMAGLEGSTLDALRMALSSILVRVSNQDSDTRYAAVEKNVDADAVYDSFLAAARKMSRVLPAPDHALPPARVIESNILDVAAEDVGQPIGLVITSPPYPNAYEYWLYHKYRMYWLGYDPLAVRRHEIGARAHYFKSNPPTHADFGAQLGHVFHMLARGVVDGGHVCVVVGRSRIHGHVFDNARLVEEVGERHGFTLVANLVRQIASSRKSFNLSHARIRTENIVVLRKGEGG